MESESSQLENEEELSEHTQAMRRATRYCLDTIASLSLSPTGLRHFDWNRDASLRSLRRRMAYNEFWNMSSSSEETVFPRVQHLDHISSDDFRRRFHDLNLPCLVDFDSARCDQCWFGFVDNHWRLPKNLNNNEQHTVNRNWFLETLGAETRVPVRFQAQDTAVLDAEGRATECKTQQMSILDWINMLNNSMEVGTKTQHYLKDWHLLVQLKEHYSCPPCLYTCPPIFEFDLLNPFLTRFTKGDYRFCYWGPQGSFTSRHSDVLHSFSWSYNVVGTKQWTFFRDETVHYEKSEVVDTPSGGSHRNDRITVIQKAGQAMFVPSTWQHEVVNLEETISINHNWLTTANLDQCWECLTTEMLDIQQELTAWNIHDNWEAQESMLRGCVGLDVTSFFLMVAVRLCELLTPARHDNCFQSNDAERESDILRLAHMIQVIREDKTVQAECRLENVLQSQGLTMQLLNVVDDLINRTLS